MAKGGLLNQVPQVNLPTTMDCNVVSIGGKTPEEYANLIAQKVAGKSNPGEYGSGTLSKAPTLDDVVKFDGVYWRVVHIDENELYLMTPYSGKTLLPYSTTNQIYQNSDIRKRAQSFFDTLSASAKSIVKVPNNIWVWNSTISNPTKIEDAMFVPTAANINVLDDYINLPQDKIFMFDLWKYQTSALKGLSRDLSPNSTVNRDGYYLADSYNTSLAYNIGYGGAGGETANKSVVGNNVYNTFCLCLNTKLL